MGGNAFSNCRGMTALTIGNGITELGKYYFYGCSSLKSVNIPNSVTSIGYNAFYNCSSLTEVTIPNSVTEIGLSAFGGCSSLRSVTIPNSVTSIGWGAFFGCSSMESVTIPNSVTEIGDAAFRGCSSLTSVTIPNSVTSIGERAFYGIDSLTVVSLIEEPFSITGRASDFMTFSLNTFKNMTLYVPEGTIEMYRATEGWKDFLLIENGTGGGGTAPGTQKCQKPTISYENGKLTFGCATKGVDFQYSITDTDIKEGSGSKVQLTTTYIVNVYATKPGYRDSDVATKEIHFGGVIDENDNGNSAVSSRGIETGAIVGKKGDVNDDGIVNGTDLQEIINVIINEE
jgi:hypothetical protein